MYSWNDELCEYISLMEVGFTQFFLLNVFSVKVRHICLIFPCMISREVKKYEKTDQAKL